MPTFTVKYKKSDGTCVAVDVAQNIKITPRNSNTVIRDFPTGPTGSGSTSLPYGQYNVYTNATTIPCLTCKYELNWGPGCPQPIVLCNPCAIPPGGRQPDPAHMIMLAVRDVEGAPVEAAQRVTAMDNGLEAPPTIDVWTDASGALTLWTDGPVTLYINDDYENPVPLNPPHEGLYEIRTAAVLSCPEQGGEEGQCQCAE